MGRVAKVGGWAVDCPFVASNQPKCQTSPNLEYKFRVQTQMVNFMVDKMGQGDFHPGPKLSDYSQNGFSSNPLLY